MPSADSFPCATLLFTVNDMCGLSPHSPQLMSTVHSFIDVGSLMMSSMRQKYS